MGLMEKTIVMHRLDNLNDIPAFERWFRERHCPEVLNQAPWFTRYCLFRCLPPPPGAEELTWCNYRVHENCVRDRDERRGVNGLMSFTPWPKGASMQTTVASIPAEPTDDFFGATLRPSDKTILRWLQFIKYPSGITLQEGEDWFLNTHVPEVIQQPGLIRFFSHKALPDDGRPPVPVSKKQAPYKGSQSHNILNGIHWDRVNELWYENNNGWVASNVTHKPHYTKPSWANYEHYPFFRPGQNFASAFLLEYPDQDFLRTSHYTYF